MEIKLVKDEKMTLSENFADVKSLILSDQGLAGDVLLIELADGRAVGIDGSFVVLYKSLNDFFEQTGAVVQKHHVINLF